MWLGTQNSAEMHTPQRLIIIFADLVNTVWYDAEIKPHLQTLEGDALIRSQLALMMKQEKISKPMDFGNLGSVKPTLT